MLGPVTGWLGTHRLRGFLLLTGLMASCGAAIWTATPVSSVGQLVDVEGRPVPDASGKQQSS